MHRISEFISDLKNYLGQIPLRRSDIYWTDENKRRKLPKDKLKKFRKLQKKRGVR